MFWRAYACSVYRPGGVAQDLPIGLLTISCFYTAFSSRIDEFVRTFIRKSYMEQRLVDIGVVLLKMQKTGLLWCYVTWSGALWDLRRTQPYVNL